MDLGEFSDELKEKVQPVYVVENFVDEHPIYFDSAKMWWVWNEGRSCWEMKDDVDILNMVYRGLDMPGIVKNGLKGQYITSFQMVAREKAPEPMPKEWIQLADVVVDLSRDCQTMSPSHGYFLTNPIPWRYVGSKEECPVIDRLFEEWVGPDQKQMLYEICAYCMLPDYPIHKIFCLIGSGRNGKGTFMRLLKKLVGSDNVTSTTLDRLADSRFEASKLYKKTVAFVGETNFAALNNTAMIKSLVGQDLIPAEFKNKPAFDFENAAKIIIATNSLPATGDKTIGFYSRWIIIDFKAFYDVERDVLAEVTDEEYSALARKCVKMLPGMLARGSFTGEGSYQEKMERYEDRSNPMKKFMAERMVIGGMEDKIAFWEFKNRFLAYLNDNKFRRMNEDEIKGQLSDNNIELVRGNFYEGEERRQWLSIFGYKWKEKVESSQKSGTDGIVGSQSSLSSLYKGTEWETATNDTTNTITPIISNNQGVCSLCKDRGEVVMLPDKYAADHRDIPVCLKCERGLSQ